MSLLFVNYIVWPVKLWPLIDLIKNTKENDEFVDLLWNKISTVTYFKKFKELPENNKIIKLNKIQKIKYKFNNTKAEEFANLLMQNWGKNFRTEIEKMLLLIESNDLKPEFPIPENENELKLFLGIEKTSTDQRRQIRQELRIIAQEDSVIYKTV